MFETVELASLLMAEYSCRMQWAGGRCLVYQIRAGVGGAADKMD